MVRHHLLLPHTATRRDLEDPATVVRVVETLEGRAGAGALLLDLLDALAEADSLATGPGVWSPWKRVLIARPGRPLPGAAGRGGVARAHRAVAGGDRPWRPRWRAEGRPQVRLEPGRPGDGHRRAAEDRTGGLAAAAGVLALHSLEVHAAELSADVACPGSRCSASPCRPGSAGCPTRRCCARTWPRARRQPGAGRGAGAARSATTRPRRRPANRPPPARVLWFDDEATGAVVMELRGTDRIGLLHRVAAALASAASACAGRGSRRSGRRSSTRSASPPTAARSGSRSGAGSSRRCSPRRGSPTGTERANRTLARCASRSPRPARPEPAARGRDARRGQVHAARPPARPARVAVLDSDA